MHSLVFKDVNDPLAETRKKLEGAKYHLQLMTDAYPDNRDTLDWELDAFLVKARSSLDVMLEDANRFFHLGIPLADKMTPNLFRDKAKKAGDAKAQGFIDWYEKEKTSLSGGRIYSVLLKYDGIRNISEHRRGAAPDRAQISIPSSVMLVDAISVQKHNASVDKIDSNGNLIEEKRDVAHIPSRADLPPLATKDWFFSQLPGQNVIQVCQQLLDRLVSFVKDAEKHL